MTTEIELTYYGGRPVRREPLFLVEKENLEIIFSSPYKLENAFLILYDQKQKQIKFRIFHNSKSVLIPNEYLVAGELNLEVVLTAHGQVVKHIRVEPILIKEIDGTLSAVPEIDYLKNTLQSLSAEYAATVKELEEYKNAVSGQFKSIIEAHNKLAEQVKVLLEEQAL